MLSRVLHELEAAWASLGAPVDQVLAPGADRTEVQALLDRWPAVPDDLITWFAWHNGTRAGVNEFQLAPSVWSLFSLSTVIAEHDIALHVAEELVGWADEGFGWSPTWIPFIGLREDVLAIDCHSGQLVRGDLGDPDRFGDVVAPDVETLVRAWLGILQSGYADFRWNAVGHWEFDIRASAPDGARGYLM